MTWRSGRPGTGERGVALDFGWLGSATPAESLNLGTGLFEGDDRIVGPVRFGLPFLVDGRANHYGRYDADSDEQHGVDDGPTPLSNMARGCMRDGLFHR